MPNKPIKYTSNLDNDLKKFFQCQHNSQNFSLKFESSEAEKLLFEKFDANHDKKISTAEVEQFMFAFKGGNEDNIDFEFNDEQFEKFKEIAGIKPEDNIDKQTVETMFKKLSKEVSKTVMSWYTQDQSFHIDNNLENNLNNLQTNLSFTTENDKFNKILKSYDTEIQDDSLSPIEVRKIWADIKNNCLQVKNGITSFDEQKIKTYIAEKFKDKDITIEDFMNFINTINLAAQNTNSKNNVNYETSSINEPNGKLDNAFDQRGVGDCYLMATLVSLKNNKRGLDIINKCLTKDSNGNMYVNLKGAKETYVITPEELTADSKKNYSSGDGDVRTIELAIEKYYESRSADGGIDGGRSIEAMYLLTGIDERSFANMKPTTITDEQIQTFGTEDKIITVSSRNRSKSPIYCRSSQGYAFQLQANHAYSVSRQDEQFVYIYDPRYTQYGEIRVRRDIFKSFFTNLSVIDLDKDNSQPKTKNLLYDTYESMRKRERVADVSQLQHTQENEASLQNLISTNHNVLINNLSLTDNEKKVLAKFHQGKLDQMNKAEILAFTTALKGGNAENTEILFDQKSLQKFREIAGLTAEDSVSDTDIKRLYNKLFTKIKAQFSNQ